MDSTRDFTLSLRIRQDNRSARNSLTVAERRLLLGASLRLLERRHTCGKKIFKNDLVRLSRFADDADLETVWMEQW